MRLPDCARPLPPTAVLDLDGTLISGAVGTRYLEDLIADNHCHIGQAERCLRLIERRTTGELPRAQVMAEAYRAYAAAIDGTLEAHGRATADKTWNRCSKRLFPFVRPLVAALKLRGFQIFLISGNADPIVQAAVADLGLTWGQGLTSELRSRRFAGELTITPGAPGGKTVVMRQLLDHDRFDHSTTLALGNTANDADVFRFVGHPVAFEPDPALRLLADHHLWPMADRSSVLATCRRLAEAITAQ